MTEYIEKQHLMDFLDGCIEEEKGNRSQVIVEAIKMTVERMPSENVAERKRGKWEVIDVANLDLTYGGRIYVGTFAESLLETLIYRKNTAEKLFLRKINYAFDYQKKDIEDYYREKRRDLEDAAVESLDTELPPEDEDHS